MSIASSLLNRTSEVKETSGEWKSHSPANTELLLGTCVYRYSDIDLAAKGAEDHAIPASASDRFLVVEKALKLLQSKREEILKIAKLELGRTEVDLSDEWNQTENFLKALAQASDFNFEYTNPRGLSVVLGSYVWPLFYTAQFSILNFLAGNPVVLKPSEKATRTVLAFASVLREIPELRSIQVLVGEKEVGRRMATHEAVSTILFQGSFEVGMRVKQDALSQPAKEVLLYLGSKNPSVVFGDAKVGVEEELLKDAFLGAGQHCRSVSVIFVQKNRLKSFVERFHELSKNFSIGGPDSQAFMGPLIDGAMVDRYLKFIGISEREGAEILMRGKLFTKVQKGHFVTPTIAVFDSLTPDQFRKSVSLQTETLSPHVSIIGFEDEAELLALFSMMTHGRLASVWTKDETRAKRIASQMVAGEVIQNASVYLPDPMATTQARKRSGNHALLGLGLLSQLVFQKSIHS